MQSIPETTLPFFQKYNFNCLAPERNGDLVIERLLAYGNRDEVRWILRYYRPPRVQRWLSEVGTHRLPQRRYQLWCVLLNVAEALRKPAP